MHFVAFHRLCTSWVSKTWIYGKAWSLFQEYETNNNFIGFRLIWHSGKTEILLRYGIYFWEALRLSYITILDNSCPIISIYDLSNLDYDILWKFPWKYVTSCWISHNTPRLTFPWKDKLSIRLIYSSLIFVLYTKFNFGS